MNRVPLPTLLTFCQECTESGHGFTHPFTLVPDEWQSRR